MLRPVSASKDLHIDGTVLRERGDQLVGQNLAHPHLGPLRQQCRHGRPPAVAADRIEPASRSFAPPPGERWPLACFSPEADLIALAEAPAVEAETPDAPGPLRLLRVFP